MIYRDHNIYPHIVLIDDVAYVDIEHGPTVAEVMTEVARVGESRARRLLKINEAQQKAAEAFARDSWCTPAPLAAVLPPRERLLDPCSNPRSIVDADIKYMLERGENGRTLPWPGLVYVNAGFSDLLPWTVKLATEKERETCGQCHGPVDYWNDASGGNASCACCVEGPEACARVFEGACFMVNHDHSTRWFQRLSELLPCVLLLDSRQRFEPHPGVPKSTNNKPQSLIGDRAFFEACKPELFAMGEMYERTSIRRSAA